MDKRILIIDDHNDLRSALSEIFGERGYQVITLENRNEALGIPDFNAFDLVITDLDDCHVISIPSQNGNGTPAVLPKNDDIETIRAFKISASSFNRGAFDEEELKNLFETVLAYKTKHIDKAHLVKTVREKIEFEFPSTISLMHSILDYLMGRVEKIGVADKENSHLFVALDEAFVNAVKHGNKFDVNKLVKVSADISPSEARFSIEDQGEGFDVHSIPNPLDPENLFKSSGRGVLIIHNVMDEVTYNERGNLVTMVKKTQNTNDKSK